MTKAKLRLVLRYSKLLKDGTVDAELNVLMEEILVLHRHGLVSRQNKLEQKSSYVSEDTQDRVYRMADAIEKLMYLRLQKVKKLNENFDRFFAIVDKGADVSAMGSLNNIREHLYDSMGDWIDSLRPGNPDILMEINASKLVDADLKLE